MQIMSYISLAAHYIATSALSKIKGPANTASEVMSKEKSNLKQYYGIILSRMPSQLLQRMAATLSS